MNKHDQSTVVTLYFDRVGSSPAENSEVSGPRQMTEK
jgi:hypothetical protein